MSAADWQAALRPLCRIGHDLAVHAQGAIDVETLRSAAACAVVGVSADGIRTAGQVGQATVDSPFRVASLTKPLTAVGVVLATGGAGITLETPVFDVLAGIRANWKADHTLTIADVLSQTSGLASTVTAADVASLGDGDDALLPAAQLVVSAGNARPRAMLWEYYNGNYFLAGAVLAALTGMSYEQAMQELVLRPWGLAATSFTVPADLTPGIDQGELVSIASYPRGRRPSGGLCSTVADLLTFGDHLLARPDLLAKLGTVHTLADDPMRYGLGWAVGPSGQMYLNGRLPGYRTALLLVPAHKLVGVVLAANSDALPAAARVLSDLQQGVTGDDLAEAIDAFAA
jgi:CubicO group peptidase (beta-lactamase class C family)